MQLAIRGQAQMLACNTLSSALDIGACFESPQDIQHHRSDQNKATRHQTNGEANTNNSACFQVLASASCRRSLLSG